jgi:S-adenosylhomocysteine hydrolase
MNPRFTLPFFVILLIIVVMGPRKISAAAQSKLNSHKVLDIAPFKNHEIVNKEYPTDHSSDFGLLKILSNLVAKNNIDFSDINLLIIQHIKKNSIGFIRLLKSAGFKNVLIVGKPYSVDVEALEELRKTFTVFLPDNYELESLTIIKRVTQPFIDNGEKFLCLDLGGYFSRYFFDIGYKIFNLIGIVEDTKNGIWFDSDKEKYLPFPLLSVASSRLKDYAEHYFVAKAIARNTENIIINNFQQTLTGKKILICGYGQIGANIAKILKPESQVFIYDIDEIQRLKAKINGYGIIENLRNISEFDVIIGITGNFVLNEELLALKNNVFLVNGSTRKKEFNLSSIDKHIVTEKNLSAITHISLDNNKCINILANGYPVNFCGTESTPEYILDIVFSEMFMLLQITREKGLRPGFYPIEREFPYIEKIVAASWLENYK